MTAEFHHVASAHSNIDALHALAARGAPDGTAIAADVVTKARGARGRVWHAPRGGLWLSVLRRPAGAPPAGVLSLRVGLALAEALERVSGTPVEVKWPNDLMLAGRKVGGILCELRWQGADLAWAVIGVGINVENAVPEAVSGSATSLAEHRSGVRLDEVRAMAVSVIRTIEVDRPTLDADELAAFAARDWLAGRTVLGPTVGVCRGISEDGALRVAAEGGPPRLLRSSEGLVIATAAPAPDVTPSTPPA